MPTPVPVESLRLTLDEATRDLIDAYEVAGRSPHTTLLFVTHVGRLARFVELDGITSLDQVTPAHVTRFLASERKRGLKPASLSVALRTIRRFFAYHVEQGNLTTNPAKAVMAPTVVVEPVRFLDDAQVERLLKHLDSQTTTMEGLRDRALVGVALDTGLRRGELVGLRVEDVALDERLISVRPATSKTRKGRTVIVSKTTAAALRRYMRARTAYAARTGRSGCADLWLAQKGVLTANGALQAIHYRLAAAGLPKVSLHSFRHRFAARAVEQGLPMPYLMSVGGWSRADQPTQRYGMYGVEGRALSAMADLLDRPAVAR